MPSILAPSGAPNIVKGQTYSVDWSHPIARGLSHINVLNSNILNYPTYTIFSIGTFSQTGSTLPATSVAGSAGVGLGGGNYVVDVNTGLKWASTGIKLNQSEGTTAGYAALGPQGTGDYQSLMTLTNGTAYYFGPFRHGGQRSYLFGWYNFGSIYIEGATDSFPVDGTPMIYGTSWNAAAPFQKGYINGRVAASSTSAFSTGDTTGFDLRIANDFTLNRTWLQTPRDIIYWFGIWNRALNDSEFAYLNANPMCFLVPAEYEMPILLVPVTLRQKHFRFRTDTGAADATPTWGALEDAN
jgi:hypothetical protein